MWKFCEPAEGCFDGVQKAVGEVFSTMLGKIGGL
jgi:hypothetical protein